MRFLSSQDLWAGVIFIVVGAAAIVVGADYQMGRAAQMGPGYVPRLLGYGLVLFGLLIAGKGLASGSATVEKGALRPVLLIIGGTLLFGLLIDRAGLAITVALVTLLTAYAAHERPKLLHIVILAVVLSFASALLFVYGLRQAIPIWWDAA